MKTVLHQTFSPVTGPFPQRVSPAATALVAALAILLAPAAAWGAAQDSAPAADTPPEAAVGTPPISVTYTGNEGFLISVEGRKILIDSLYREGVSGYVSPPQAQRDKMESGQAPFDGVNLALSTHYHSDHFHPEAVGTFLQNNSSAIFISTDQARKALRKAFPGFEGVKDRIRGLTPAEGGVAQEKVGDLDIQIFNLHHGRKLTVENIGFLIHAGGRTMLHMGDTEATATDLSPFGLANKKIDVAFVPFWYLLTDGWQRAIRKQVAPEHIVVMHLPAPDADDNYINSLGGWEKVAADIKADFPNATIFRQQMESARF